MVKSFLLLSKHLASAAQYFPYRRQKKLNYKEVVFSGNDDSNKTEYPAECFIKFTALGKNAPSKNDDVKSKSVNTRSQSTLASGSSSIGMMPEIYIFCTKKNRKDNDNKKKLISVETKDFEEKIKKYATTLGD